MTKNRELNIAEAKKHFSELLGRVAYGGERITISKRGKPMAVLVPPEDPSAQSNLAKLEGWLEPDHPFFESIEEIIRDRERRLPRLFESHEE
jgi:prevent-host-death family protein